MTHTGGYFLTGLESDRITKWQAAQHLSGMNLWEYLKLILASDYTLYSALIGSTMVSMAAFGTDQDMVQRMLTAETYKQSRRSLILSAFMDLPIAAAFTFIGSCSMSSISKTRPLSRPPMRMYSGLYSPYPLGSARVDTGGSVCNRHGIAVRRPERAGDQRHQRLVHSLLCARA